MTHLRHTSSAPTHWVSPRPHSDASIRFQKHGKIQPMEKPSFLKRLFGRK